MAHKYTLKVLAFYSEAQRKTEYALLFVRETDTVMVAIDAHAIPMLKWLEFIDALFNKKNYTLTVKTRFGNVLKIVITSYGKLILVGQFSRVISMPTAYLTPVFENIRKTVENELNDKLGYNISISAPKTEG